MHQRARRDRRLDARQDPRRGPDAAALLERLYPNRFADLKPGRIRYGVLTTDGGRIMDDGTVGAARRRALLRHDDVDRLGRASASGSSGGTRSGATTPRSSTSPARSRRVNLAGPQARDALASLTDADVSNERLQVPRREGRSEVAGVPCLALRIGFVGELGYELHCAATVARASVGRVRRARRAAVRPRAAARASPREGARDRRPGHGLRVEPALGRACRGSSSRTRTTSSASGRCRTSIVRERLVGFTLPIDVLPAEGAQVVQRRHVRPAASRAPDVSERLGNGDRPRLRRSGARGRGRDDRRSGSTGSSSTTRAVTLAPFYDPDGSAAPVVTGLDFLSPDAATSPGLAAAARPDGVRRRLAPRQARGARRRRPRGAIPIGPGSRARRRSKATLRAERERLLARGLPRLRHDRGARRARGRRRGRCCGGSTELDLDALPAVGSIAARHARR